MHARVATVAKQGMRWREEEEITSATRFTRTEEEEERTVSAGEIFFAILPQLRPRRFG